MKHITQEALKMVLDYNPDDGVFTWKVRAARNVLEGRRAGNKDKDGYIRIVINRRKYFAHRLAWIYMFGELPLSQIDHINGVSGDNRIINLRQATNSENSHNYPRPKSNKSGVKGVCLEKNSGKWKAYCMLERKSNHLGYFNKLEDAKEAVRRFRELNHGEYCNHGLPDGVLK